MITNKDRENAVSMTKIWIRDSEGNQLEDIAGIIAHIRAESADQARKEADEKLAIAVKALKIASDFCGSLTADECPDTVAIPINDALKEIQ